MLLAQTYANNASINLTGNEKPILPNQYFPVPADKYITIQNSSGMGAKNYGLWADVINLIKPYLDKNNIEIVQLGQGEVQPLNNVISLVNKTNFAQSVYVLKNALLHVGNDSWCAHACAEDVPCVVLYGSTSIECHSPYITHSKSRFIESHRFGRNTSYQAQEAGFQTINLIKPELVAKSILEILEIENNITQNTILLGDIYAAGVTEINLIPNAILNPESVPAPQINLRADLYFDINYIVANLQRRKYILWLDREMDLNVLKQLKPNIEVIIYRVDEDTDPKYLTKIQKLGIPLHPYTKMSPEDLNKIKLDYLELPVINKHENISLNQIKDRIKNYNNDKELKDDEFFNQKIYYKSKKHYLSDGKIYNSITDWRKQISVENVDFPSVADFTDQDFINQTNHFLFFSE
ncbi:glycosyltransferase family 9 protein [Flavobacterium sp.]|uniref:glycosyltransferase family 9 protein n=1 Tax=Flavobacterium sp. TaxID=239 RepID=UPI0038FC11CC